MLANVEVDFVPSFGQVEGEYLGVIGHLFDVEECGIEFFDFLVEQSQQTCDGSQPNQNSADDENGPQILQNKRFGLQTFVLQPHIDPSFIAEERVSGSTDVRDPRPEVVHDS